MNATRILYKDALGKEQAMHVCYWSAYQTTKSTVAIHSICGALIRAGNTDIRLLTMFEDGASSLYPYNP